MALERNQLLSYRNAMVGKFRRQLREIDPILRAVYGREASVWRRRWRTFFLATAESFGFDDGVAGV